MRTDDHVLYQAAKWLKQKKRETRAQEMPDEVMAEFRQLFGGKEPTATHQEPITSVWRDL